MTHEPSVTRYESMPYRACGRSGLQLPALSLGAWETFGGYRDRDVARECLYAAFDLGITHFDFANNYGTPPGNAELVCGEVLKGLPRDELILSSKAGYRMWPGPYGDGGSRKYLIASCDQSLRRMGLEYFDLFYSHRPDPSTPIEETIGALDHLVRQGKTLYVGVSNYEGAQFKAALAAGDGLGRRILVHQPHYNLLARGIETDLLPHTTAAGVGVIAYGPLASGMLTGKYLTGEIPADSRAGSRWGAPWVTGSLTEDRRRVLLELDAMARARGQTLAQMALAWVARQETITSALIGVSRVEQLREDVAALANLEFSAGELERIDTLTM